MVELVGGDRGGAGRRKRQAPRLIAKRAWYPLAQVARERREPLRSRIGAARAGHDLSALPGSGLSWLARHPVGAVARTFGVASRSGPVWAVTMIKNEEVRVRPSVLRLVEGGVDLVVVADNASTDASLDVLAELARSHPVVVVRDREPAYFQGPKMSRLARAAAARGAAWIIPFDADEVWLAPLGGEPLADCLRHSRGDAVRAQMYDFLPRPGAPPARDPLRDMTRRVRRPGARKIAFRAHLLASVHSGNHWVGQPVRLDRDLQFTIRHYPFLGFEHFLAKARQGSAALALTDFRENVGAHWRAWGTASDDELRQTWDDMLGGDLVEDPLPASS